MVDFFLAGLVLAGVGFFAAFLVPTFFFAAGFLGSGGAKTCFCLCQKIDFVLAWDSCVGGENETKSRSRSAFRPLTHPRLRSTLLLPSAGCSRRGNKIRSYVVGELIGVDVNESMEQDAKLRRREGGRGIVEDAV